MTRLRARLWCCLPSGLLWLVVTHLVILPLIVLSLWSLADGWFGEHWLPTQLTLRHWRSVGADLALLVAFLRSVGIACVVTVLAAALALPAAWALARGPVRLRRVIELLVLAPLIVPGLVVAASLGRLFLDLGLTYSVPGVVLVQLIGVLPLTIRALTAALATLPAELWWAARSLGATPMAAMTHVVLPLARRPLGVVATLTAVTSFEEFDRSFLVGAPIVETLPLRLYFLLDGSGTVLPTAAVASLLLLLPVLLLVFKGQRRSPHEPPAERPSRIADFH